MMELYDFSTIKVLGSYLGQMNHQNGADGKIWGYYCPDLIGRC